MSRCRNLSPLGLAIFAALVSVGCSRQNEPAAPIAAPPPVATSTNELSSGPLDEGEPPAESGLAIKRGTVAANGDHALFRACDDPAELWLVDGEGALTQLLTAETTSLYVEAYGERGPVPDDLVAAKGKAGVFMLEQLLYASVGGEGRGCARPMPGYTVAARGNEPFWAAEVTATGMVWKQPQDPKEISLGELQSEDAEGAVIYRASDAQHKLELHIEAQTSRDSMSGEYFAFAARAVLDGREFKGCAHVGKQDGP